MVDSTTSNVNSNTESNQVGDEGVRETQPPNQAAAAAEAVAAAPAAEAAAAAPAAEAAAAAAAAAEEKEILKMKKTMKSHLIVAALIATVTFGAGFTLPGGYIPNEGNDHGMAVLSLPTNGNKGNDRLMEIAVRKSFRVFVVADSIAMILSMCAIGIYFLASLPFKNKSTIRFLVLYGYYLTMFAMTAMVGAFVAGLKAVLYHSSLLEDATTFILVAFLLLFLVPALVLFVASIGNFGW